MRSDGEGGMTPALAAVISAIVNALAELGVHHMKSAGHPLAGLARDPCSCRKKNVEGLKAFRCP